MKTKLKFNRLFLLSTFCFLLSAFCFPLSLFAQGTAFTYQGRLNNGTNVANGSFDLQFAIYDAASGGLKQAPFITNSATAVSNGLFTVTLDFGPGVFPGAARWLDIGVRTNGPGSPGFTLLSPRQALTATPYAIFAGGASNLVGAVSSANLAGTYAQAVTLNNPGNVFAGNGAGVTNVNAVTLNGLGSGAFWQLGGNNVSPGQFLGSTNNQPVEINVNGQRALRLEPTAGGAPNVIGGSPANIIGAGLEGSSIGGGGSAIYSNSVASSYSTVAGGYANSIRSNGFSSFVGGGFNNIIDGGINAAIVGGGANLISGAGTTIIGGGEINRIHRLSHYSVIGGGQDNSIFDQSGHSVIAGGNANSIGTNATYVSLLGGWRNGIGNSSSLSTLGGGFANLIQSNTAYAAIFGGNQNNIGSSSDHAFIGGGRSNTIQSNGYYATISGGYFNTIETNAAQSTIAGGYQNKIQTNSHAATISGGILNLIQFGGVNATIGGGGGNVIQSNAAGSTIGGGDYNGIVSNSSEATIPGGYRNAAASFAFAAGQRAKAVHPGSFVWADSPIFYDGDEFSSTGTNQFLIRAGGGVGINTSNPVVSLTVEGKGIYNALGAAAIVLRNTTANKSWEWHVIDDGNMQLADYSAGATRLTILTNGNITVGGNISANSFITASDRNAKENFSPVNAQDVLAKVAALPISQWNFKSESAVQHVGPMAQDFRAAFGLGPDEKHIATVDADGVALAAIQGLNEKVESGKRKAETQIEKLATENAELKTQLNELKVLVRQLAEGKQK